MKKRKTYEWDEEQDEAMTGPKPKRLNLHEKPDEIARRLMQAGKPEPGELDEEEEWEEDEEA